MGNADSGNGGRPYRGLSPLERRADRRRRLLDAGLELFGSAGYSNTSIEQICSFARVTTRHFYEEYGSREELLKAVYVEVVAHSSRKIIEALDNTPNEMTARIRSGVDAFVRSMLDDPRHARVFCVEVVGVSPEMEIHRRSVLHLFAQVVQQQSDSLRANGQVTFPEGMNFTYTTLALVGGTTELITEWVMGGQRLPVCDIVEELVWLYTTIGVTMLGIDPATVETELLRPKSRRTPARGSQLLTSIVMNSSE